MLDVIPQFTPVAWVLLTLSALIVGVSKTALPGANTISIAIFASLMPARESTGALLLLLIIGDIFAVWTYRRHADWPTLARLAPAVIAGVILGVVFLAVAGDASVRRVIGIILLALVALTLWLRSGRGKKAAGGSLTRTGFGAMAGFTTMVANSGGPVMSMYFLAAQFPVKAFLGTAAWFFAIINVVKVPFSVGLGLITVPSLALDLLLVPAVVAGAFAGRWIAGRINQRAFEYAVLILTVSGAIYLLITA